MKISSLLKALNLAKPSLGSADSVLPILSHFCFAPDMVYAYNDVTATLVFEETALVGALHGDTLIGILEASTDEEVKVKMDKSGARLDAGTGWVKVPSLPQKDFVVGLLESLEEKPDITVKVSEEITRALELCLMSVGTDSANPDFTGITIKINKGQMVFYSSNNVSASRYSSEGRIAGRKDIAFVLPATACEQLLKLQTTMGRGSMSFSDKVACISYPAHYQQVGDAQDYPEVVLVSKLLEAKVDFESVFSQHVANTKSFALPPQLQAELRKAVVLLGRDTLKECTLSFNGGGYMMIEATGTLGTMRSTIGVADKKVTGIIRMNPELLLRVLPHVDKMLINNGRSVVVGGGNYVNVISGYPPPTSPAPSGPADIDDDSDIHF